MKWPRLTTRRTARGKCVTVTSASRHLGISPETLRRWCRDGRINAWQPGGRNSSWLVPVAELQRLLTDLTDLADPTEISGEPTP